MADFVERLWNNPAIKNASIQRKENQILSFIKDNSIQLKNTLTQSQFFPDLSWDDIIRLLFTELTEKIIHEMEPRIDAVLKRSAKPQIIDFFLEPGKGGANSFDVDLLKQFIVSNLRSKQLRDHYVHVVDAVSYRIFDRYLPVILERRKVIYYELIRRDRLDIPEDQVIHLLNFTSLFRPLYWHKIPEEPGSDTMISPGGVARNKKLFEEVMIRMVDLVRQEAGEIPGTIIQFGLDSWRDASENPELSGISRLINILTNRAQEFDPQQTHDRGAESPDKSWFNINRKTARFYGYDMKFLDELYQIASEERW